MDILTAFSIIALAALIHASFQLGVSMVTLLSSHTTGKKMKPGRSLGLVGAFLGGTVTMTALIVTAISFTASSLLRHNVSPVIWSALCGILVGVGLAIWIFYYRRGDGTSLWIPRSFARFLDERIRATTIGAEAFSLGLTGVIAELLFVLAPATAAALSLLALPSRLQLIGVILYTLIASLGMLIVTVLIGSGHKLSAIQRWREQNKRFLQFAAGSGLIILGFYLYANQVIAVSTIAGMQ